MNFEQPLIELLFYAALLGLVLLLYIRLARKHDILDVPNARSSHKQVTIRGAGVVFIAAVLLAFVKSRFANPILFGSLFLGGLTGFLDDRYTLSSRFRLLLYGVCAGGITYLITDPEPGNWGTWLPFALVFVFVLGTVNTVNFMDGINGITTLYTLVLLAFVLQMPLNAAHHSIDYTDVLLLALLLFGVLNVRKNALCFMGDSGSIVLGLFASYLVYDLAFSNGRIEYLLLLAVYGVDSLGTILIRLLNRENITVAHRSHAYQLLSNEGGWGHIRVSVLYAVLQLIVNYLLWVWVVTHWPVFPLIAGVLIVLVVLYLTVKYKFDRSALLLWK